MKNRGIRAKKAVKAEKKRSDMHLYERFSTLLEYPQSDILPFILDCMTALHSDYQEAKAHLKEFSTYARSVKLTSLQEQYSFTFDINPVCTLDIGYHVFGESYKRGSFLVGMQKMLDEHGINAHEELPDYLPNILKLLTRMPRDDEYDSLIRLVITPALARMKGSFKEQNNSYGSLIRAVDSVMRKDLNLSEKDILKVSPADSNFSRCAFQNGIPQHISFSQKRQKNNFEFFNRGESNG